MNEERTVNTWLMSDIFRILKEELGLLMEDFTCFKCPRKSGCPSSYDFYCTDGDCLEVK